VSVAWLPAAFPPLVWVGFALLVAGAGRRRAVAVMGAALFAAGTLGATATFAFRGGMFDFGHGVVFLSALATPVVLPLLSLAASRRLRPSARWALLAVGPLAGLILPIAAGFAWSDACVRRDVTDAAPLLAAAEAWRAAHGAWPATADLDPSLSRLYSQQCRVRGWLAEPIHSPFTLTDCHGARAVAYQAYGVDYVYVLDEDRPVRNDPFEPVCSPAR
jgi:hypothetical protein